MAAINNRLAVLVGCNYRGTRLERHYGWKDALSMKELLVNRFEFCPENITVMTDDASSNNIHPTGVNIRHQLQRMIRRARNGDVLFFYFSGQGPQIPFRGGLPHLHQAIVPSDFNLITDVEFRHLVDQVPKGATLTIVAESSHSGGLILGEKEQINIGEDSNINVTGRLESSAVEPDRREEEGIIDTTLQAMITNHLATLSGVDSLDLATHVWALYGIESSIVFWPSMAGNIPYPVLRDDSSGILLSACRPEETANEDICIPGGRAGSLFTNSLLRVLLTGDSPITNKDLVGSVRDLVSSRLATHHLRQHPSLYCSDGNAGTAFLLQGANANNA